MRGCLAAERLSSLWLCGSITTQVRWQRDSVYKNGMEILAPADVGPLLIVALSVASFVTAFIGVSMSPGVMSDFEEALRGLPEVLECHHVTGSYSLLIKVKTQNTQTLEGLISRLRLLDGVLRTETLIVLSTSLERTTIPLGVNVDDPPPVRRAAAAREKISAE